jgi:hypothetical protein
MMRQRFKSIWLGLLAGALWAGAVAQARSQQAATRADAAQDRARAAAQVPLDQLPPRLREGARHALEKPTVFSRGPAEAFACDPAVYYYFLDHPDRAVNAWRRLGAKCLSITDRGNGRFGWTDEYGSDIVWETVYRTPELRVWYAEGKARPTAMLPLVPVRAVVLMHHVEGRDRDGNPVIRHQTDMFLRTDSLAASLASKVMGGSPARLAEQNLGQLQMFFAGLAWYLHRHPERADVLLQESLDNAPPATPERPTGN